MKHTEFINAFADRHEDEKILRADGLDEACIGWTDSWNGKERNIRLVYDIAKVINIIQERDGSTYEDALEHFEYNIAGGYVGKSTPIYVNSLQDTSEYYL